MFNINITDLDGNADKVLVYNITDRISEEKDIAKMIQEGGALYARGQKAVRISKVD